VTIPEATGPTPDEGEDELITIDPDTQGSDPAPLVPGDPGYEPETPLLDSLAASGQKLGYTPPVARPAGDAGPRDVLVEVPIGADGTGTALSGLDPDYVDGARILNGEGEVTAEPSHTVAITRVTVTRSNFAEGGTALVALTPK
jgi:hypothetical protein